MKLDLAIAQHLEKLPLSLQSEVLDYVLYLEQKAEKQSASDSERRKRLASALQKVVAMNPYAEIEAQAQSVLSRLRANPARIRGDGLAIKQDDLYDRASLRC
jgi:hypothetical protein